MKILFLNPESLSLKQVEFRKKQVANREKDSVLQFLFGKDVSPGNVADMIKTKKIQQINFIGISPETMKSITDCLTRKFPNKDFSHENTSSGSKTIITQKREAKLEVA